MGYINNVLTGKRIKDLAEANGLTVEMLATELRTVSIQAIYKWYRGDAVPNLDNLVALSIVLKTPIEKIVVIERGE